MSLRRVLSSSVGTKVLIGVTGLLLFAYLLLHLAGNLLVFAGPSTFNEYAHVLISNPLTTPVEIALLLVFLLHVYKTVTMCSRTSARGPSGMKKSHGQDTRAARCRLHHDDLDRPGHPAVRRHPSGADEYGPWSVGQPAIRDLPHGSRGVLVADGAGISSSA
jgi:hypothetical protein